MQFRAQQPFFLMQPSARVSRSVDQVAAKLIHQEQEGARPKGLGAFIKRFASFFGENTPRLQELPSMAAKEGATAGRRPEGIRSRAGAAS